MPRQALQGESEERIQAMRGARERSVRPPGRGPAKKPDGITIIVEKPVLSRNRINQFHWATRHRESQEWEEAIWAEIKAKVKGPLPQALGKMRVAITSFRQRLLDVDNLIGGIKGCLDSLKRLGLILDDSPELVELDVRQIRVKGDKTKTKIEITEAM